MTSKVDDDLIMILSNLSVDIKVRLMAWEYLLSLIASEDGLKRVSSYAKYGTFLFDYLKTPGAEKETLPMAYKCLISLAGSAVGSSFLLASQRDLIRRLLEEVSDISSGHSFVVDKCYILSNLSQHCDILSQAGPSFCDLWRTKLRSIFCSSEKEVRDKYAFLSFVFSNISRTSEGRKLFIEDESFLSSFLLGLSPEESASRRLGMALTLRNCCSETSHHKKLLEDYNILPVLLLPLMDSEEFEEDIMEKLPVECQYLEESKARENVPQIRKALVQALSLLCYTEESWQHLQDKGVYYVIREFHKWESDLDVNEAIETLVGFLLVENYTDSESLQTVIPSETDLSQDIPDVVL